MSATEAVSQSENVQALASTEARVFASFRIAERLFGVDIRDVKEIRPMQRITPVFRAPPVTLGYVNVRGMLHLILDGRRLLGLPPARTTPEELGGKRLVLFRANVGSGLGLLVDRIGDVQTAFDEAIETLSAGRSAASGGGLSDRGEAMVEGACKLEEGLMVILQPRHFLEALGGQSAREGAAETPESGEEVR